ncbi:MAG TPA: hypothetical protein VJU61_16480 [Polyangiaceae bacterium]|nr:hypothetical protein [Polyangiaceae bacterium]
MRSARGRALSSLCCGGLAAACLLGCGPDEDIRISSPTDTKTPVAGSCSLSGMLSEALPEATLADAGAPADPLPHFSFFVTSQAGLYGLAAGQYAPAPDPAQGYGGDLGGLRGADEICSMLAQRANPGDRKVWRAFLSSSGSVSGERVDAIGRVGPGPWYDYNGVLLARDLRGLLPDTSGRPTGAVAPLKRMFSDENGEAAQVPAQDNHDTLTGSDSCGRLYDDGANGATATCNDWTSKTLHGREGNLAGVGGQIPVGHSWPRAFGAGFGGDDALGARWIGDHTISGCEPGYDVNGGQGAPAGDFRVGAGGGYGGFYCFALGAVAPML